MRIALAKQFKWLYDLEEVLTSYNEGQKENSENNSLVIAGLPRSGKGQVTGWAKEHGIANKDIKLFETHATKISHLAEILQFMFPNGFFLNRKSRFIVEGVRTQLKKESYRNPVTTLSEIEELLELHDSGRPPERVQYIDRLIDAEDNQSLVQRLKEAKKYQEEIQDRLNQTHREVYTNPDIPATFRKSYPGGQMNRGFDIQVFTPISRKMPSGSVPDFFEPFAIPVDAYEKHEQLKWGLHMIHTEKFKQYQGFYGRVVQVGDTSFQSLRSVDEIGGSDYMVEREYGDGKSFTDVRVLDERNIKQKFQRDWNDMFFPEGVVCSSGFEYTLRDRLKKAMLSDEPDIICLYTGFLRSETIRKFVIIYFMETMFDIVRNLSGRELRRLDRQFIASMIEAQEIVKKSSNDTNLSTADKVFNRFIKEAMNDSGHYNFNFWFDTKADETHPALLSKPEKRIVTRMKKEDVESWYKGDTKDKMLKAFSKDTDPNYVSLDRRYPEYGYGFLYLSSGIPEWRKNGRRTLGHRLPCPRMCVQDPVDEISNDDWSFFTEELGFDSIDFQEYQDALFKEDWEESAKPFIEEAKRQKKKEKQKEKEEEMDKAEMRKQLACEKLRNKVDPRDGIPGAWTSLHEEIRDEMAEEGHIPDNFKVRTVMGYTEDLRSRLKDKAERIAEEELDAGEIADELKRQEEFLTSDFPKSEKKAWAAMYIQDEYDVGQELAEQVAEDAAMRAWMWLKSKGFMDSNHNHKPEKLDEYRETLGLNVPEEEVQEASALEDEPEYQPPGEEWNCSCGAVNGDDRSVCRQCAKSYEEVHGESEE